MYLRRSEVLLVLTAALALLLPAGCAKKRELVTNPRVGPTANFVATPVSGERPLDVDFTDQSSPGTSPITTYLWNFGDGFTSADHNAAHSYESPGIYTVSLTVTSADGSDTETKNGLITVSNGSGPIAAFSGTPRSGIAPLEVSFTDESDPGSSTITSRSWDFGDGGTSTATNPNHTYLANGNYTVSLTVTTSLGSDNETKTGYIIVSPAPVPPTAAFSGTPRSGTAPLQVQFTDESTQGSATITSWSWDFGDGGTSTEANPAYTYLADGTYTVRLSVTTSVGTDTETKTGYITVTPALVPPTAAFSGTPRDGTAPLQVQFTDQSTQGSAAITSWAWSFGDGGTSTEQNPDHEYSAVGTYSVSLTVTTSAGSDSETKPNYITARGAPVPPTADFSGTPTSGPAPLNVQFTDQSTAGSAPITARIWTFGDGSAASSATNPSHTYAAPGSYDVSLVVTTADGQDSETKTAYIQVCETPTADFTGAPTLGTAPLTVLFTDASTGNATSWSWTFGDGGTSTSQNPSHIYDDTGTYTVSLTVQNGCGTNTVTKPAYITVVDPCPDPVYTVVNALAWTNVTDQDNDGYRTRGRLTWNVNVSPAGCSKSVYARIYYRAVGETTWLLGPQTACYTVYGSRALNSRSQFVEGLPFGCYDFRIALYECGGTVEKAALEPTDDSDLRNQCFELP